MKRQTLNLLTLLLFAITTSLQAAGAKRGWTKIELSHADGKRAPVSAALLTRFGAELLGDYGAYSIVYAPKGLVTAFEAQAAKENLRFTVRDDLDLLHLPNATVDAREGISAAFGAKLTREYPPGKPGVYVVQFVAPLRAEWMDGLAAAGWKFSRYLPNNGYLIVGTPELVGKTRQLPFVQWLDFYHAYQKAKFIGSDVTSQDLVFELAEGAASEAGIEAIRAAAEGPIDVRRLPLDTHVYARMNAAAAEELLGHEVILSVSQKTVGRISDERQVMSLTSNLNVNQSAPTSPTGYWNWVTSRCPDCLNMPASTWKIGIADTGLDNGLPSGGHPDLADRKFFGSALHFGDLECTPDNRLCDKRGHGTFVSAVAVGRGAGGTNAVDPLGYYLGQGVAPTAGVFMTKIMRVGGQPEKERLLEWTADAANGGVTIQNHSWNEGADAVVGRYSLLSREFDIATRHALYGTGSSTRIPMLFTVSSGNTVNGDQTNRYLTLPGATAKNVLSVGALENYRPNDVCGDVRADDFRNIMRESRVGTALDGFIKPDLMSPGSQIVSAHTTEPTALPIGGDCLTAYRALGPYNGLVGTSFSAPVGAGAALLVKRYLGTSPADVSPALTRAVLIAGARSVRGGLDRRTDPATPISAIPSQQQGFGRLSLDDILNNQQKPVVYDQSASRTFTQPGQTFTTTVRVRDASKPVKIALVWTDAPALVGSDYPLVNDLDLQVRRSSDPTQVHIGNKLWVPSSSAGEVSIAYGSSSGLQYDRRNTIEFARLFVNDGEELTITVIAANIVHDTNGAGGPEQDFALAILNGQICDSTTIAQHPQNQTIQPGQTATVTVVPGGTGPWDYQWYEGPVGNFTSPVCINTASCVVGPLTSTRQYWVSVRGTCGSVYSNPGVVTVQCTAAPTITAQPGSPTINPGQSATIGVGTTQAVSYQWYQGTAPSTASPVGTNSHLLTVTPGATTNYWVRVTNACGSVNSITATVCVRVAINAQPTPRTITVGQSTTLSVTASGVSTYQWFQGTAPSTATPVGTNSSSLTVTPVATTSYWVRVSNSCGFLNSVTATVTVVPPAPVQITRLQSAFALANSQTSITATWAQPTQAGNFLVAVISGRTDPNGSVVWTAPAGWVLATYEEWSNIKAAIYYLPNSAGSRISETFTVAAGYHDQTLYLFEYSGIAATSPLDKTATNGDSTNDGYVQTGFTANTVQPKELVITALTTYTPTVFFAPSSNFIELYDKFIGNRLTTAVHEKITTAAGSQGHNAQVGNPEQWIGLVATFKGAN